MKKLLFCVLAMILMLSCSALSEGAPFTFRNGVQFGMSMDQVIACEGSEPGEHDFLTEDSPWECLEWYDVPVSRFSAQLNYIFNGDQLKLAVYDFYNRLHADSGDVDYLKAAIDEVYGEGVISEPEEILAIMNMLVPGLYNLDSFDYRYIWRLDGVRVFLLSYENERSYSLMYVSDTMASSEYDTHGL